MRCLERNMTSLYYSIPTVADEKDLDNNYTGQKIKTYGTPVAFKIALYPSDGTIANQIFGKDASFDMIAVSTDVVLTKDTLIYKTLPTTNLDKVYDYLVSDMKVSLNGYAYGLRGRV